MVKVLVLAEGQTEETFIRDILYPYLEEKGVYAYATLAVTKKAKSGLRFRGGVTSYSRVKKDVKLLLRDTSAALVTTMIDFYGLPDDFPGRATLPEGPYDKRVAHLERAFAKDVNDRRFLPHLQVHEYEAFLFVSPEVTARVFAKGTAVTEIQRIRRGFNSPEQIDEGQTTAPSKRILNIFPEYQKPLHGPLVAKRVGIDLLRSECEHFDLWIRELQALGS